MKLKPGKLAQILYDAVRDIADGEVPAVVGSYVRFLSRTNQLRNFRRITERFSELVQQDLGVVEAEVLSKKKLSPETITAIRTQLKKKYQAKEIDIQEVVRPEMIGGVVIRTNNEMIDGSIGRQVKELERVLSR